MNACKGLCVIDRVTFVTAYFFIKIERVLKIAGKKFIQTICNRYHLMLCLVLIIFVRY